MAKFKKGDIVKSVKNTLTTYVVARASRDGQFVDLNVVGAKYADTSKFKNISVLILRKV